jgi:UDP-N-acetylmuramoylalanine--D-glutamate ligase
MQHLEGKRVLVVGLARSGRAAADFLHRRGAVVTVSDSRPPWSFADEIPELLAAKIGLEFGQHGTETALAQDLVVVSPGVPWDLPALQAARERGIPVVAEVEAGSWFLRGDLVGVTGSNGKTTTTTLIGRMLESSGIHALVGGNIGVPITSMVDGSTDEGAVVVELSSFQLEGTQSLHPRVAVILNITPNHLDRHPSLEAYVEAKARILRNQDAGDYAVLNADDPAVRALADRVRAQKVFFSRTQDLTEGLLISEGKVVYRVAHLERELFSPRDVRLRGLFNLENVLAASAAACVLGADFDALGKTVREFRGVEHRLEPVGEVLGVEFYNDSKATSVDATAKALGAFDRGVHLILGGKDKGAPYAPLVPLLKGRVREVLLIGAAAGRIAAELAETVELVQAGDLESATRQAFRRARAGDVVLLSPACSSYDQFQDFEHRGRVFKALVESLAREGEAVRASRSRAALQGLAPKPKPKALLAPAPKLEPQAPPSGSLPDVIPAPEEGRNAPARDASAAPPETGGAGETAAPDFAEPAPAVVQEPAPESASTVSAIPEMPEVPASTEAPVVLWDEPAQPAEPEEPVEPFEPREVDRPVAGPGRGAVEAAGPAVPAVPDPPKSTGVPEPEPKIGVAAGVPEIPQPERIYVYEMDAEERPPLDLPDESPLDQVELVRNRAPDANRILDSTELRAGSDEPLIFEVTAAAAEPPVGRSAEAPPAPERNVGRARRRKRGKGGERPPEGDDGGQDRFPGV